MISEVIQTLYRYNTWANARILDTATQLGVEQFLASGGTSYDSLRDTLVHTMSGQWIFLERWRGRSPRAMLNAAEISLMWRPSVDAGTKSSGRHRHLLWHSLTLNSPRMSSTPTRKVSAGRTHFGNKCFIRLITRRNIAAKQPSCSHSSATRPGGWTFSITSICYIDLRNRK